MAKVDRITQEDFLTQIERAAAMFDLSGGSVLSKEELQWLEDAVEDDAVTQSQKTDTRDN
ncbi:hypothetical protein LA304_10925 [Celeribacter sp. ASW11-22]|nr:hypothetical protein [Celeribacter litoreus]